MSSIVKEHQANGVSLYKAACEKEMITSCFHYLNEKLKIYLSLPASMNAAASKRHFLRFSTTPGFTVKEEPYHRTGFMLPIDPPVKNVLKSFLSGTPGEVIFNLIGNAELREITENKSPAFASFLLGSGLLGPAWTCPDAFKKV